MGFDSTINFNIFSNNYDRIYGLYELGNNSHFFKFYILNVNFINIYFKEHIFHLNVIQHTLHVKHNPIMHLIKTLGKPSNPR